MTHLGAILFAVAVWIGINISKEGRRKNEYLKKQKSPQP